MWKWWNGTTSLSVDFDKCISWNENFWSKIPSFYFDTDLTSDEINVISTPVVLQWWHSCALCFRVLVWSQSFTCSSIFHLSTLYQPIWYNDFIALNLLAYPCFELLDRITRVGIPDNAVSLHFYGTASLLIFIVGGFANFVAEFLTLDSVRGMNGSIASLLGYYSAAKPKRIMLNWIGMALTSGDVFFGVLILTCSCILLGFGNFLGSWRISDSIAWGVGGVLGFFICRLQLEHFYNIWSWSF